MPRNLAWKAALSTLLVLTLSVSWSAEEMIEDSMAWTYTTAMFGKVGVVRFPCSQEILDQLVSDFIICGMSYAHFTEFREQWNYYLPTELSPLTPWRAIAPRVMYSGYMHEKGEFIHYGISYEDGLVIATTSQQD